MENICMNKKFVDEMDEESEFAKGRKFQEGYERGKNNEIMIEDYDEFQETEEMIVVLKALKTTFWFFFWTGSFLLGFIIGRNF